MTRPVSEEFVYLEASGEDVGGTGLLTRPVGLAIGEADVLVAIDSERQKHLLIPSAEASKEIDTSSQGVQLGNRTLRVGDQDVEYADLVCRMRHLDLVFERLVDDLIRRIESDSASPVETTRQTLDEWRALLRSAGGQLDREVIVGLVGELEVLRRMSRHAPAPLETWRGPSMAVHDFVNNGWELEVKATASVDGNFVSVSNLDQLDPALVTHLNLLVVHVREDDSAPSIDERMAQLCQLGVARDELIQRVEQAGYVYEAAPNLGRFSVRSVRGWAVGASFPGLRGTALGERRRRGVSRVRYDLALDAAPPRMSDSELEELLKRWVS